MVQLSSLLLCLTILIVSTILFFFSTTIKWKSATSFIDRSTKINEEVDTISTSSTAVSTGLNSVRRFHNRKKLNAQEIIDYIYWTNGSSCQLAHDFGGVMMRKPSGFDGQKAVCLDPPVRPPPGDCLVYSFGIGGDWSFEEAMEAYGCRVDQRDHQEPRWLQRPHLFWDRFLSAFTKWQSHFLQTTLLI